MTVFDGQNEKHFTSPNFHNRRVSLPQIVYRKNSLKPYFCTFCGGGSHSTATATATATVCVYMIL